MLIDIFTTEEMFTCERCRENCLIEDFGSEGEGEGVCADCVEALMDEAEDRLAVSRE